jgi:hypothetical protein
MSGTSCGLFSVNIPTSSNIILEPMKLFQLSELYNLTVAEFQITVRYLYQR